MGCCCIACRRCLANNYHYNDPDFIYNNENGVLRNLENIEDERVLMAFESKPSCAKRGAVVWSYDHFRRLNYVVIPPLFLFQDVMHEPKECVGWISAILASHSLKTNGYRPHLNIWIRWLSNTRLFQEKTIMQLHSNWLKLWIMSIILTSDKVMVLCSVSDKIFGTRGGQTT